MGSAVEVVVAAAAMIHLPRIRLELHQGQSQRVRNDRLQGVVLASPVAGLAGMEQPPALRQAMEQVIIWVVATTIESVRENGSSTPRARVGLRLGISLAAVEDRRLQEVLEGAQASHLLLRPAAVDTKAQDLVALGEDEATVIDTLHLTKFTLMY